MRRQLNNHGENVMNTSKLPNGQLDLQQEFEYRGTKFTCSSWGKGSTAHSYHTVNGEINGIIRTFSSTTRKQAKDMFKKAVRKSMNQSNAN